MKINPFHTKVPFLYPLKLVNMMEARLVTSSGHRIFYAERTDKYKKRCVNTKTVRFICSSIFLRLWICPSLSIPPETTLSQTIQDSQIDLIILSFLTSSHCEVRFSPIFFSILQKSTLIKKFQCLPNVKKQITHLNPLSANPTKWSNTLKQFVGKLPTNCLSVFDYFVELALKGLNATNLTQGETTFPLF